MTRATIPHQTDVDVGKSSSQPYKPAYISPDVVEWVISLLIPLPLSFISAIFETGCLEALGPTTALERDLEGKQEKNEDARDILHPVQRVWWRDDERFPAWDPPLVASHILCPQSKLWLRVDSRQTLTARGGLQALCTEKLLGARGEHCHVHCPSRGLRALLYAFLSASLRARIQTFCP